MNARLRNLWLPLSSSMLLLVGVWTILCFTEPAVALAQAGTGILRVATTGTDVIGCGSVVAPCRTVQYAVNQAADSDEIRVATGIYSDTHTRLIGSFYVTQTVHITKSITLRGGYTTDFATWDPQTYPTTLDAHAQGRVILIRGSGSLTATLEGLRIVNGRGGCDLVDGGGGVNATSSALSLTIRSCDIVSNTAYCASGGGMRLTTNIPPVVDNNRFIGNTANQWGGGCAGCGGVTTHNLFLNNVSQGAGGGMRGAGYVAYNTFQGNTAHEGGGLYGGAGTLVHNSFLGNTADGYGGGLYADVSSGNTYTVALNLFQDNVASQNSSANGGGAYVEISSNGWFVFSNNQVIGNTASKGPQPSAGGGLWVRGPALIADNLFQGNWANDHANGAGNGGGLYVTGPAWLERNRILDNRASQTGDWGGYYTAYGAGIYVARYAVTMTNNIIARNLCCETCYPELYYTDGDAIYVGGQTSPAETQLYLYHNTIADNGVNAIRDESAAITMSHNIFSGHARDLRSNARYGGYAPPAVTADYTLWYPAMSAQIISGTFVHTNDFTGTPAFVSIPLDDYHLGPTSQAIDKGPGVGVTDDIDGHPRPVGAGYDLGADEYTGVDLSPSRKTASPPDATAGQVVTFTLVLHNSGTTIATNASLFDAIPLSTTYVPGSAQASSGVVTYTDGIGWTGSIAPGAPVTITFRVTVDQGVLITNTAIVTDTYGITTPLTAWVNAKHVYLPVVLRASGP
jgi:uncharacterized repeat protein (TIGR01451 family)